MKYLAIETNGDIKAVDVTPSTPVFASNAEAVAGTETAKALSPKGLRDGLNATGTAPIYACRAWGNINGTGTITIMGSGNVSSITDNGVGSYTVKLINAMPDVNYAAVATGSNGSTGRLVLAAVPISTTSFSIDCNQPTVANVDPTVCNFAIFR